MKKTVIIFAATVLGMYMFFIGMDCLVSAINIWTGLLFGLVGAMFLGYGMPDSTAKCNTLLKNFGRRSVVQAFARSCV
jgi:high-affinity Fe2+/Pb2+ permease